LGPRGVGFDGEISEIVDAGVVEMFEVVVGSESGKVIGSMDNGV
jgi:hypothetical protein